MERDRPKSSPIQHRRSISDFVAQPPTDSEDDSSSHAPSGPPTPLQWEQIVLGDLVSKEALISIDSDANVVNAFEIMEGNNLSCLPVAKNGTVFDSFDHTDLNAYLLLVTGQVEANNEDREFQSQLERAKRGIPSTVNFAAQLGVKDPFVRVNISSPIMTAVRRFANGVHRIAAVDDRDAVVGILSQRRMLDFIWNNIRRFPALEPALNKTLEELHIGTYKSVLTIFGDIPVIQAFALMHENAVSSLAVVDRDNNLLGNISVADVALVTNSRNSALLQMSTKHFLTVILDNRGIVDGKDSVPVFFVEPNSKLRLVIAKLVATKAHRLWIVEPGTDHTSSGKLMGVISLTDIFNFVMRQSGHTLDPETARRNRRSSSSSVRSNSQIRKQLFQ